MQNNLSARRKELKLTQLQVAKSVGIAEAAYQRYEYGAVLPSVYVAIRLARVLNTTVEDLFPDTPSPSKFD